MKRKLKVSVSKSPQTSGVVACRSMTIREKFLAFLFGTKRRITILIPGDNIDELSICETEKGGIENESVTL